MVFDSFAAKVVNFILIIVVFYLFGCVMNGIIVGEIFGISIEMITLWSAPGFLCMFVAGIVGALLSSLYTRLTKEDEEDDK